MARRNPAQKQIRTIRRSVTAIERALKRLAPLIRERAEVRGTDVPRRKLKLSPKRRAALRLQGRYMGYMRQLKPPQKARVRMVKLKKGYRAAIAVARRLARGRHTGRG